MTMTVKELIKQLERLEPNANVYYRKGRTLYSVTESRVNPHTDSIVELTNPENR